MVGSFLLFLVAVWGMLSEWGCLVPQLLSALIGAAEFFDPNNQEAAHRRHRAADLALTDMIQWLQVLGIEFLCPLVVRLA